MTVEELPPAVVPQVLSDSARWRIFAYLGVLMVLLGLGSPGGGLIGIPVTFFLKNKLHLAAHQSAIFLLIAAIPAYVSFLFGFVRDQWNPFGMRDRGFMVLFGGICAVIYVAFAFTPLRYETLLAAAFLLGSAFLFVSSAQNGLMGQVAQQHLMTGQISALSNIVGTLPLIASLLLGGVLSQQLEGANARLSALVLFLCGAAIMGAVALYGLWRPRVVYDNLRAEQGPKPHPWSDFKRLLRHWPIYPALLIWVMFNFAPGSGTPLQYYLQDTLHSNDAQWGDWNAIFAASFIPTYVLYGVLCRKYALRTLLFWGTLVTVPQLVPLLFIHSVTGALIAAVPIGLMGGVAAAAYMDLLIRACPTGLQGTMLMLSAAIYAITTQFGNLLGTSLYDHYKSFTACVIAITVVYALIVPALWLVPRRLTETSDGEAPDGGFDADRAIGA